METFLNFFYNVTLYVNGIPLLIGFYFWKRLNLPLKIFLIGGCLGFIISMVSLILSKFKINTHILFYLMCLLLVFTYSFFYKYLLSFKYSKLFFNSAPVLFTTYFLFDLWLKGIQQYFAFPFVVLDILIICCAIMYYRLPIQEKAISFLNVGILIYYSLDICMTLSSKFLFNYYQNKGFEIVFFGISSAMSLFFIFFEGRAFYLSKKHTIPSFNDLCDFQ